MSSTAASSRLFLAVWPDDEVRRRIDDWARRIEWPATAAPVPPDRFHVTLHFIGNVPAAKVDAVRAALHVPVEGCSLRLDDASVWSNGIAALTPLATPPALVRLHNDLAVVLRSNGMHVEERSWRPHVTLARKARGTALPPPPDIDWLMEAAYVLVQSVPGGDYLVVHRYQ